jgi:Zn-dependent M28 family amino/carboxypeptidase
MNRRLAQAAPILFGLLVACGEPDPVTEVATPVVEHSPQSEVEADLHRHTMVLASDEFGGREPGTAGEEKTINYLRESFLALGLEPGNGDSWFQEVPVTSVTTNPDTTLHLAGSDLDMALAYGTDMMAFTPRQVEQVAVTDSPLVFVGYGIVAPERDWNDYAGVDVTGKTVVMLINDPGYASQDPALFNGNTMTYYGRWDYKYEEAARQGASGVLIVHETKAAAYPWGVVRSSWSGPQLALTAADRNIDRSAVEGWITLQVAENLFQGVGLDYKKQKALAGKAGFRAVPLGDVTASISLDNTLNSTRSKNVVGRLRGSKYPDEHIIYTAHWDHLGTREGEGDTIYNGASDNASGVAGLLAIARQYMEAGQSPERSVVFLSVTGEESGLLGSLWYGNNPLYPLGTTVANLNMDNIYKGVDGENRDVAVVGYGNSELDDYLAVEAASQDRVVVEEPNPEKGYYYRSDHLHFARQGVPALYLTRSADSHEHGAQWGQERLDAYTANDYHQPSDEYSPLWDFSGSAQDVLLLYGLGNKLAASRDWPAWKPGVEFRALREETASARSQ